jgi:quinol monooxygenase YgiN
MSSEWEFVVIWEFRVHPEAKDRFEMAYGPQGDWAALFARSGDFVRTDLVPDPADPLLFRTLDYWTSGAAYEHFRQQHAAEYKAIDARCEAMTESEVEIGRFDRDEFAPANG